MKRKLSLALLCILVGCQSFKSEDTCLPYVLIGDLDTKLQTNQPGVQIKSVRATSCSTSPKQTDICFMIQSHVSKEMKGQEVPLFIVLVNKNQEVVERKDINIKAESQTEVSARFILPDHYHIPITDHRLMVGFSLSEQERSELQAYKQQHISRQLNITDPNKAVEAKLHQMQAKEPK